MANVHYMKPEKGGEVIRVAANEWAKYRSQGYIFVTEADYRDQPKPEPVAKKKAKKKTAKKKTSG